MKASEFFQRTMDWYVDGIGFRDGFSSPTVSPDGAYDAVGNLVNAGDKVLWIKGHRKGSIQTVTAIESSGYTGTQNILASDDYWPRMYNLIKI